MRRPGSQRTKVLCLSGATPALKSGWNGVGRRRVRDRADGVRQDVASWNTMIWRPDLSDGAGDEDDVAG